MSLKMKDACSVPYVASRETRDYMGGGSMSWQVIVALVVAVPVVLLPVAFVWYLNAGGIFAALRERAKQPQAAKVEAKNGTTE